MNISFTRMQIIQRLVKWVMLTHIMHVYVFVSCSTDGPEKLSIAQRNNEGPVLKCSATGKPSPTYKWQKGSDVLHEGDELDLCKYDINDDNIGQLQCTATVSLNGRNSSSTSRISEWINEGTISSLCKTGECFNTSIWRTNRRNL